MNRLRATPIAAAALALLACVVLASAGPAQTPPLPLDDFNRPDETPALFVAITADGVRAIEVRSGVRRVLVSVITVSRSVS